MCDIGLYLNKFGGQMLGMYVCMLTLQVLNLNGILNTGPFCDRTTFNHLKTRHVRYSDPDCIKVSLIVLIINFKNHICLIFTQQKC